jgi:opacity protein-like surface antigen
MNKALFFLLLIFMGTGMTAVNAEIYTSGNLGLGYVQDADLLKNGVGGDIEYSLGPVVTVSVGEDFKNGLRAEGELAFRINTWCYDSKYDTKSMSLMANAFYDFMPEKTITPFAMLGVGFAQLESYFYHKSESDTVYAYQGGVGLSFSLKNNLKFDLQYRMLATEDPQFGEFESEYFTHSLLIGLRGF